MSHSSDYGFNTRAIHAGMPADPATGSRQIPIYQSASYQFQDAQHAADLFNLDAEGYVYSRLTNPTVAALEARLAALEGGTGATCAASGIAAHMMALFPLIESGEEFIASNKLYGGTVNQLSSSFKRFGWRCHLVNPDDPENFRKALTPKCKAIFIESQSNPAGVVADIEAIAAIAHEAGIPLIVDNTVPSPYLCEPFRWGADIITHSTTKYLCGNGTTIGGVVIDSGRFDWSAQADKFPHLAKAEPAYNGRNFHASFGDKAYSVYNHAVGLRDLGPTMSPMNAFLTLNGIETLGLRLQRHSDNARRTAEFLRDHPAVEAVQYSGFSDSPYYALAQKYLPKGVGSLFTFTLRAGYDACVAFVDKVQLFSHVANIGDARSLIIHPASTTHHQLNAEQMRSVGITPNMIRISVGIEDIADILADLDRALHQADRKAA